MTNQNHHADHACRNTSRSLFSSLAEKSISLYQTEISPHKGYRCAHAQCRGGMSCSAFIQNVIQSSPNGHLSAEDKGRIADRLRECKALSTVAGLSTYQATKKILLTAGAVGAGAFLISASAFAATCGDSGGGSGGCGSSGASDNTPKDCTVINGITVPPEPDTKANSATIAGVDSNNNGVRDDLERKIAEQSEPNTDSYNKKIEIQKMVELILNSDESEASLKNIRSKMNEIMCKYKLISTGPELMDLTLNNNDRTEKYIRILRLIDNQNSFIDPCTGETNEL